MRAKGAVRSKRTSGVSEQANGRASGPVLTFLFLFVPDHSAMWASSYWESTRDQVRLTVPEEPATEDAYDDDDGWLDYKAFFSGGMEGNWRGSLFQGKGGVFF